MLLAGVAHTSQHASQKTVAIYELVLEDEADVGEEGTEEDQVGSDVGSEHQVIVHPLPWCLPFTLAEIPVFS